MKKFLLLFLMCVYASIGAWAEEATVTITTGSGATANATINSNANCENIQNTDGWQTVAANTKFIGDYSGMIWANLWWHVYNQGSGNSRFDFSEASNVSVSNIETLMGLQSEHTQSYCFVGVTKLVLPNNIAIPSDISALNRLGNLKFVFSTIDSSTGEYQIYVTSNLTSTSDLSEDITSSVITALQGTGTIKIVGDPTAVALVQNWLVDTNNVPSTNITAVPTKDPIEYDSTNTCVITINRDYSSDTVENLIGTAQTNLSDGDALTADICTIKINGTLSAIDLEDLGSTNAAGVTRIDMSEATLASGVDINSLQIPTTLTSLVLPPAQTVDATLAGTLEGATNLKYAYSPSSDGTATGPNQADETKSTYSYDATKNNIADYVWVNQAGGLKQAFENEEQLRNSFYIKVASDVALTQTDVDFNGCTNKPTNYLFLDFSESNLTPSVAASYTVTDNIGYRIILPNGLSGDQMAVFAANPNCGNLAAVYSYDGTTLKIMEIVDASYSQAALANPRIMRSGTTEVDVVSGYYDGNTYAQFGTNLLAALNNMGKSSFSVTKNDVVTNYTNTLGQSVKTISIETTSAAPNALTFDNPSITTLKAENLVQNNAELNVTACSALTSLSVKGSNLKSVTASGNTSITSADLSGTAIAATTNFNGATKLATFTTTSESIFNGNVDLTSSKLSAFTSEARFGGNINFNASSSLASINLSGATIASTSVVHIDEDATEATENTSVIDALKVSATKTIKLPSSFPTDAVTLATRIHPYAEAADYIEVASTVAPAYNITTTDMTFHDKEAGDNTDHYRYWYMGAVDSQKILTLGTSDSRRLSDAIAEIPEGQNYSTTQYAKIKVVGPLTSADITSLQDLNCTALDLSEATSGETGENAKTIGELLKASFSDTETLGVRVHSNVKFIALPDSCTRDFILNESALAGLKNSVYCVIAVNETSDGKDLTSYSFQSGSLQPAVVAFQNSAANSWTRILSTETTPTTKYTSTVSNFKKLKISGLINSYDLSKANQKLDADGHLAWKEDVVESTGQTRTLIEDDANNNIYAYNVYGPFSSCFLLTEIDLRDAYFEPKSTGEDTSVYFRYWYSDMTLSFLDIISTATYKVVIPQNSKVREVPADFMRCSTNIRAICIPSNIQAIRTRAFYTIDYVWTTPDAFASGSTTADPEGSNTRLDNGASLSVDGGTTFVETSALVYNKQTHKYEENPAFLDSYYTANYGTENGGGTYTFGSTLKLIETAAFANTQPNVKDVYVLNTTAPECHVDAFNTVMYTGNGGYNSAKVDSEGIITRDAYYNGRWITKLHYPRQTTDPNIQRYTDPTRSYSIATGERDGKGAPLYYPNQSEFIRAYQQGTYGYTWNAWGPTRQYGSVNNEPLTNTTAGWTAANQAVANQLYKNYKDTLDAKIDNNIVLTSTEAAHKYYSFYDVSLGGNTKPTDLVDYYNVNWNNGYTTVTPQANLYPRSEIEAGSDVDGSGEQTTKDYRGWHQFVLTAYAANTVLEEEPYRSYITDNEWWTICPTFDITREEAIILFGNRSNATVPFVSKLRYVIRDYGRKTIFLSFTENLCMKQEIRANSTDKHGTVNATTGILYISNDTPNAGDIVMSAGVPYLIKPTFPAGSSRQYRIYKNQNDIPNTTETNIIQIAHEGLYNKIKAAQEENGTTQRNHIKNGIYTVPVFVSEAGGEGLTKESVVMEEGKPKLYTIGDIKYQKSTVWSYSFVGTFYKSFLPHYCFFLGWDSSLNNGNGGAKFYYHNGNFDTLDREMSWNNETGVICPLPTSKLSEGKFPWEVTEAQNMETPAQWELLDKLSDEAFKTTNGNNARRYEVMEFNAPDVIAVDDSETTGIENVNGDINESLNGSNMNVYTINGQYVGTSLNGLAKGVYIVNGKKFIVK